MLSRVKLDGTGATIKLGRRRRGVGDPEPHRRRAQAPRDRPLSRRVSGAPGSPSLIDAPRQSPSGADPVPAASPSPDERLGDDGVARPRPAFAFAASAARRR